MTTKRALLGYIFLTCIVCIAGFVPKPGYMLFGDDIFHQYYYFREFFVQWLQKGVFPWWNPYIFGGQPFIADPMVNIWYPLTWLFVFLPLSYAYPIHLAFHVFWAMMGMGVLSSKFKVQSSQKEIRGMSVGAWVSGVVFGLSGFFMARTWAGHVDVIAAASWIPWVVFAFMEKRWVLASVLFALQLLSGYQTMAFFTVGIVGLGMASQSVQEKSIRPLVLAAAFGLLGIGLSAIQILPVQEFFRSSIRTYPLPYAWVSYGAWEWKSLLQLFNPFFFGTPTTYTGPQPNFIEHSAFIGVLGLALSVIGIWKSFAERQFLFLFVAVFGLWVSLGPHAPIDLQYLLWKTVPMYRYLRIPSRHLILLVFGLSGLAGMGFAAIPSSRKAFQVLIVALVLVEMVLFGRHFIEIRPVPKPDAAVVSVLSKDTQPYRLFQDFGVWLPQREALEFDGVMSQGIFSATGYDTSILRPYFEYVSRQAGKEGSEMVLSHDVQVPYLSSDNADAIDRLNIKYVMVPRAYDPFAGVPRYTMVYEDAARDFRMYENTTVKPRFYLEKPCGSADVVSYTPNVVVVSVTATCETRLLSSENWYPGWTATIDGMSVPVGVTDGVFRVVSVSAGTHRVRYEYRPTIFLYGALVSIISAVLLWYMRKRIV